MKNNYIYIGRFQPFHNGHLHIINDILEIKNENKCDRLIILVGSANVARDIRNPFTFEERKQMIENALAESLDEKRLSKRDITVHIEPIEDSIYSNNVWLSNVQKTVKKFTSSIDKFFLAGKSKSDTGYLKYFPQYENALSTSTQFNSVTATQIRELYFCQSNQDQKLSFMIPIETYAFMKEFKNLDGGSVYDNLVNEFDYIVKYKNKFKNEPYYRPSVTGDAVVTCCGHLLIITRKTYPGKGLYALPGGFFKESDSSQIATAIRELKEETKINVKDDVLNGYIKSSMDFTDPMRSLRGRILTKAVHICLPDELVLPKIKGSDDAATAFWMPIDDVIDNRHMFFEDHYQIIRCILSI